MANLLWEDSLLERKLESDLKDLLKTLVAFANSVKPGHVAQILIGERNDGSPQGVRNADNIQKIVRDTCNRIYPPILWRTQVYERDGTTCISVEIEYSGETPHFGGPAWVRRGSVIEEASDEVFQQLIEFRLSKVRELAQWVDRDVTVEADLGMPLDVRQFGTRYEAHPRWGRGSSKAVLKLVNSFWATFDNEGHQRSEPLEKIILSWDDRENRLKVLISL
jgi:schlafen family protein